MSTKSVYFFVVAFVIGFVSEKRIKAEEKIIKERDRSQKILATIGEAVYIFDRDLKITEVNRAHLKTFDMNGEEAIGKKCYELFFNRKEICQDCPLPGVFEKGVCVRVERMAILPEGAKKYASRLSLSPELAQNNWQFTPSNQVPWVM